MNLFRKKSVAIAVMVILIAGSVLLGSKRSMESLKKEAEQVFYEGADGSGIGVASDLDRNLSIASSLQIVLRQTEDQMLTELAEDLKDQIAELEAAEGIQKLYSGNASLTKIVDMIDEQINTADITDETYNYSITLIDDFYESNKRISRDSYNVLAGDVNRELGRFPANILSRLTGVAKLNMF